MDNTLLDIPLFFWGILCLGVGVAYYFIWPSPNPKRTEPRTRWQQIVLRYFHTLVWVLLAAGCFLAGSGFGPLGGIVALLALPTYVVFLVVLLQDRGRQVSPANAVRASQRDSSSPHSEAAEDKP